MLKIENEKDKYIFDLNNEECLNHRLAVSSTDDNGNDISWGIEYTTLPEIKAHIEGSNELVVEAPLEIIRKDEYIVLSNFKKERAIIVLKPNLEILRPKIYKFKITSKKINGRDVRIKILSKEGKNEVPWICTYKGQPLPYDIRPLNSEKSSYVNIKLAGNLFNTFVSVLKFKQEKSNNVITLKLRQSNDSVEIIEAD